jgi:hypothetical protein
VLNLRKKQRKSKILKRKKEPHHVTETCAGKSRDADGSAIIVPFRQTRGRV